MVSEIRLSAKIENASDAINFVSNKLTEMDVPSSARVPLVIAVEEIFLNIAKYAYKGETGDAVIIMDTDAESHSVNMTFIDKGIYFDPLAKPDPDLTLTIKERPIGGLGILMVKKTMDEVTYSRVNDENRLTVKKTWIQEG